MTGLGCHVRNLRTDSLSGFRNEKDALAAGGCYLHPDTTGWLDVGGRTGLCVVCENCGSVIEDTSDAVELYCPDCGESLFRVFQTFRLIKIKDGFYARWHVPGLMVAIEVPNDVRAGMVGIHYTIDGGDPSLTSPIYTQPIPYHKEYAPLRAAVYYSDARSQIIEWDYGRAETNQKRIRKQSDSHNTPKSNKAKPKRITPLPKTKPKPTTPSPYSTESKDDGKGCAVLLVLAMGIGGIALICNGWPVVGWTLTIVAILTVVGMFQDKE